MKALLPFALLSSLHAAPRIIADFESDSFAPWTATGTAFAKGPAKGTLAGQMHVSGFKGQRLVNSFLGGDQSTGSLTSPAFTIEHKFLTFLIGGGGWAKETCMNLLIDGKIARTATGPNTSASGSEILSPLAWDLTDLEGKEAILQIVDNRTTGWGHINVDHIVATDDRSDIPLPVPPPQEYTRELTITHNYLQLPLLDRDARQGPGVSKFTVESPDGKHLRFARLKFPGPNQEPDFLLSYDVREFKGQKVVLRYKSHQPELLNKLTQSDEKKIDPTAYEGPHRPRFHFSPRQGWMNDVNGTYYHNGLYHLFYQANPATTAWSTGFDMHWGHSVSKDLVHWEEWPIALFPDSTGNVFSGTATMIQKPIPGVTEGMDLPAPVLFFTGTTPFSQHFATTRDGGKSWQRFEGNPVLKKLGKADRDPKVIWHEPTQHYAMILYVDGPDTYHIFRSKDLKTWEKTQVMPHWYECPEFLPFKSPTTGEDLYLLYGSYRTPKGAKENISFNSAYQLGKFDGKTFTPISKIRQAHRGPEFYAALTFQNEAKNRQIMMGWTRGIKSPEEPFNQAASIPLRMQLKDIAGQDILTYEPAEEINALRGAPILTLKNIKGKDARKALDKLKKEDLLDIVVRFKSDSPITTDIRNRKYSWDPKTKTLNGIKLHPGKELDARFLIDRSLFESFWNGGEAAFCKGALHTDSGPAFGINDDAKITELTVYPLKNIWKR